MRIMYLAFAAAMVLAVLADLGLDRVGFSAAEQSASEGNVRLD